MLKGIGASSISLYNFCIIQIQSRFHLSISGFMKFHGQGPDPWISIESMIETGRNTHMLHLWYIYLHDWAIFGVNVGKYSSTMEYLGYYDKP